MQYLIVIILLSILGIIAYYVFNLNPSKRTNLKSLYSEGLDLLINGNRRSAYNNFKEIVEKDSENIKAYLRLGQVLREGGNPGRALKIHKALLIRKNLTSFDFMELHKNLSLDYFNLNKIDKAIEEALNIIKVDKKNEWAITHLMNYYMEINDWSSAAKYLKSIQKINNIEDNHKLALFILQEGRNKQQHGDFIAARSKFEKALEIDSKMAATYYFIADTYIQESESYYQKAQTINNEEDPEFKRFIDSAKNSLSKAIPMWVKYSNSRPNQSWMVIHLLKDALFELNRYDELEKILKEILQQNNKNPEVIATLADMYAQKGEIQSAIDLVDTNIEGETRSLIIKLIRLKLNSINGQENVAKNLDEIIHFLVTDEGYHKYKNTPADEDIMWIYENSKSNEDKN